MPSERELSLTLVAISALPATLPFTSTTSPTTGARPPKPLRLAPPISTCRLPSERTFPFTLLTVLLRSASVSRVFPAIYVAWMLPAAATMPLTSTLSPVCKSLMEALLIPLTSIFVRLSTMTVCPSTASVFALVFWLIGPSKFFCVSHGGRGAAAAVDAAVHRHHHADAQIVLRDGRAVAQDGGAARIEFDSVDEDAAEAGDGTLTHAGAADAAARRLRAVAGAGCEAREQHEHQRR